MEILREGKMENQKTFEGLPFPKVFIPLHNCNSISSLTQHIHENKDFFSEELHKHGALLFRGFPVQNAIDFNDFIEAFDWQEHPYIGRATRSLVYKKVWTANEGPLTNEVFFHHEMSLNKSFPTKLFLYCEIAPPPPGGQTSILKSHKVTEHMESMFPEFVQKMQEKGLQLIETFTKEATSETLMNSWQKVYDTCDPQRVERKAALVGQRLEWKGEEVVEATKDVPTIKVFEGHDGKKMWFNLIPIAMAKDIQHTTKLKLGDGSDISEEIVEECKRFMNNECVDIAWEKGDIMMVDNLAILHARRPSLPPRRVLVAICK